MKPMHAKKITKVTSIVVLGYVQVLFMCENGVIWITPLFDSIRLVNTSSVYRKHRYKEYWPVFLKINLSDKKNFILFYNSFRAKSFCCD